MATSYDFRLVNKKSQRDFEYLNPARDVTDVMMKKSSDSIILLLRAFRNQ